MHQSDSTNIVTLSLALTGLVKNLFHLHLKKVFLGFSEVLEIEIQD